MNRQEKRANARKAAYANHAGISLEEFVALSKAERKKIRELYNAEVKVPKRVARKERWEKLDEFNASNIRAKQRAAGEKLTPRSEILAAKAKWLESCDGKV